MGKRFRILFVPSFSTIKASRGRKITLRKTFNKLSTAKQAVRKLKKRGDKGIVIKKA